MVLTSVFDLDLVFYREELNAGKRVEQSTHGIDAMIKQGWWYDKLICIEK